MNLGIQNHNFLITGASRGIGRAIAESLLIEGANVGLVARGNDQLKKTVHEYLSQLLGILVSMTLNFVLLKIFVFAR